MRDLTDEEFHSEALAGGASRHYLSNTVPDRGYMVGSARNLQDQPFPEFKHPVDQFNLEHVRHHARAIREHFGTERSADVYQGAWREGDDVVLDASQRIDRYTEAQKTAKSRGERAIYDLTTGRDMKTWGS